LRFLRLGHVSPNDGDGQAKSLLERKSDIQHALYPTLRDLFSLQVDMVFYAPLLNLF